MNKKQKSRDRKAITNKKICFKAQATALHPRLHHRERFLNPLLDLPPRDLAIRNYSHSKYTTPQYTPLDQR